MEKDDRLAMFSGRGYSGPKSTHGLVSKYIKEKGGEITDIHITSYLWPEKHLRHLVRTQKCLRACVYWDDLKLKKAGLSYNRVDTFFSHAQGTVKEWEVLNDSHPSNLWVCYEVAWNNVQYYSTFQYAYFKGEKGDIRVPISGEKILYNQIEWEAERLLRQEQYEKYYKRPEPDYWQENSAALRIDTLGLDIDDEDVEPNDALEYDWR